jgi:ADP-heptose:LPS heptosyltransferase
MKSSSMNNAERAPAQICAIFPGALGDFICFLPTLRALQQSGRVDLYARAEFTELLSDEVAVGSLDSPEIGALFQSGSPHDRALKRLECYQAVYSWHGSGNPDVVRRLREITSARAHCFRFRPAEPSAHQADYYLGCVAADRLKSTNAEIHIRQDALYWCEAFWTAQGLHGRPVLALAPGSGAREKNWPAEFFVEIVSWWRCATGGAVLSLTGPVERERGGLQRLSDCCIDAGVLSLSQLAAAVSRAQVYLGNYSGVSHLAGALGVRTVALFGPSDPLQWAPRGDKVTVLRRGIECSPCTDTIMKTCPHRACLGELSPREVSGIMARLPEVVILTR